MGGRDLEEPAFGAQNALQMPDHLLQKPVLPLDEEKTAGTQVALQERVLLLAEIGELPVAVDRQATALDDEVNRVLEQVLGEEVVVGLFPDLGQDPGMVAQKACQGVERPPGIRTRPVETQAGEIDVPGDIPAAGQIPHHHGVLPIGPGHVLDPQQIHGRGDRHAVGQPQIGRRNHSLPRQQRGFGFASQNLFPQRGRSPGEPEAGKGGPEPPLLALQPLSGPGLGSQVLHLGPELFLRLSRAQTAGPNQASRTQLEMAGQADLDDLVFLCLVPALSQPESRDVQEKGRQETEPQGRASKSSGRCRHVSSSRRAGAPSGRGDPAMT